MHGISVPRARPVIFKFHTHCVVRLGLGGFYSAPQQYVLYSAKDTLGDVIKTERTQSYETPVRMNVTSHSLLLAATRMSTVPRHIWRQAG